MVSSTIKYCAMSSCQNNLFLTQLKDWGKKKNLTATVNKQFHTGSHAVIKSNCRDAWIHKE